MSGNPEMPRIGLTNTGCRYVVWSKGSEQYSSEPNRCKDEIRQDRPPLHSGTISMLITNAYCTKENDVYPERLY
jgi:hypothetical protein